MDPTGPLRKLTRLGNVIVDVHAFLPDMNGGGCGITAEIVSASTDLACQLVDQCGVQVVRRC